MIVTDGDKGPKTGRVVENIGFYNPITKEKEINTERASYWMSVGAQPSDTVHNMLVSAGVIDGKKKNVLPQKSPVIKEEESKKEGAPTTPEATDESLAEDTPEKSEESKEEESKTEEDVKDEAPESEEKPAEEEAPKEEEKA